MVNQWN